MTLSGQVSTRSSTLAPGRSRCAWRRILVIASPAARTKARTMERSKLHDCPTASTNDLTTEREAGSLGKESEKTRATSFIGHSGVADILVVSQDARTLYIITPPSGD